MDEMEQVQLQTLSKLNNLETEVVGGKTKRRG